MKTSTSLRAARAAQKTPARGARALTRAAYLRLRSAALAKPARAGVPLTRALRAQRLAAA
jgi:hypothetical protein